MVYGVSPLRAMACVAKAAPTSAGMQSKPTADAIRHPASFAGASYLSCIRSMNSAKPVTVRS